MGHTLRDSIGLSSYQVGVGQVPQSSFLAHQLPVNNHREVDIQDAVVIDGQAQNDANQCVLALILKRWGVEPEQFGVLIVREHACRRTRRWHETSSTAKGCEADKDRKWIIQQLGTINIAVWNNMP